MVDTQREEGAPVDPITTGNHDVVEESLTEAQAAALLSEGNAMPEWDRSSLTRVSGWGSDTGGHIGRIRPYYCLQIDVYSKTDLAHPPPPAHAWTEGVMWDIIIRVVPNVWEIVPIRLGTVILFFGR